MHLHKLFMRQGRNYANQENKILRSLLYQKRIKKKSKTEGDIWKLFETEEEKKERNQRKRKNTMKE